MPDIKKTDLEVGTEKHTFSRGNTQSLFKRIMSKSEVGVIIPLIFLIIFTGLLRPNFFSVNNISAILRSLAFIGIVAIGETLVILVGEIDISVGQVAGLGAILGTWFMTHNVPVIPSILITLAICSLVGIVNGVLVSYIKVSAFIATIGMLYMVRGTKLYITKGYPVYPIPDSINTFGSETPLGISWSFIICIVLFIVFDIILRKTVYGRKVYAVGDNKDVARLAGINVRWVKISAFVFASVLSALSGILLAAQLHSGTHTIGEGWELNVIAATAVGGISLTGGAGSMGGTVIGVFILAILTNSLILLGIDTQIQTILTGMVMVGAVILDIIKRSRKVKG